MENVTKGIPTVHNDIINITIENSRINFVEEGVDEDVLQKLREIWMKKISEKNITPLAPPLNFFSLSGNAGKMSESCGRKPRKKRSTISQSQHMKPCEGIRVDNICNRSMPLLSFEEGDESTPLLNNSMVKMIPEAREQSILVQHSLSMAPNIPHKEIIQNKEHELDLLLKYKDIFNKTLIVKVVRLKNDNIINQPPAELNNNVVQKRKRGRPKKHPPVTKRKSRGKPKLLKKVLKINTVKQTEQSTSKCQRLTIMQTDGGSDNPKFKVKPKFTGIPVKTKEARLEEAELNTDDDGTDNEDLSQIFECDNVIICQYEKVQRVKNRWKIYLKQGMMHLKGKDFAFNTASGKVEW